MTKELQICSYRNDVERYLSKKYPSARKEDIEDVVQSAIIKASICQSQWRGETTLKSWLTKIAINIHNDMHRKSYFKNESLIYSEDTNSVFENIIEKDFSETLCENNYLTSLYDELMLGLEDNISIITFNLRVIDDIDYKDIAIKQNISIVKNYKAKIKLFFTGENTAYNPYHYQFNDDKTLKENFDIINADIPGDEDVTVEEYENKVQSTDFDFGYYFHNDVPGPQNSTSTTTTEVYNNTLKGYIALQTQYNNTANADEKSNVDQFFQDNVLNLDLQFLIN